MATRRKKPTHMFTPELDRRSIANADVQSGKLLEQRGGLSFLRGLWGRLPPNGLIVPKTVHVTRREGNDIREYLGTIDDGTVTLTHALEPTEVSSRFDKIPLEKITLDENSVVENTSLDLNGIGGKERDGDKKRLHFRDVQYHDLGRICQLHPKTINRGNAYVVHDGGKSYIGVFGKENPLSRAKKGKTALVFSAFYQRNPTPGVFRRINEVSMRRDDCESIRIAKIRKRGNGD